MSNVDIASAQLEAYNAQDLEKYVTYFTQDCIVSGLNGTPTETSREAIKARYAKAFAQFPQNKAKLLSRIAVGNTVVDHELVIRAPGGEQFDQRIAKRKRPAAAAGPAAQEQPGKHGDVVAPGDRPAAAAMRAGGDDGFLRRHAVNDHVEKTPDHGPEDRDGRGEKPRQLGGKFGVGGKVHRR